VPVGTSQGLPVGLQLVAPPGGEARLVEVGRTVERDMSVERPPV
jgi:amidase